MALVRSIPAVSKLKLKGEQQFGVNIIKRALEEPLRQIAQNAGYDGSVVVNEIRARKGNIGFNAASERYEDLMGAGIIDPTKVVRLALQNAASVASLLLTTEAVVAEKPKKRKAAAVSGSGYGAEY